MGKKDISEVVGTAIMTIFTIMMTVIRVDVTKRVGVVVIVDAALIICTMAANVNAIHITMMIKDVVVAGGTVTKGFKGVIATVMVIIMEVGGFMSAESLQ